MAARAAFGPPLGGIDRESQRRVARRQEAPIPRPRSFIRNGGSGQPIGKGASRDITSGNNASNPEPGFGYSAGPGFDAVSGWGVPDGVKLLHSLASV